MAQQLEAEQRIARSHRLDQLDGRCRDLEGIQESFLQASAALSAKAAEGKLVVVEAAALPEARTAQLTAHFGKLGISNALVIAGAEVDTNFARAAANIAHVDVLPQQGANVYDILRRDTLVLTKDAVKHLEERLSEERGQ